MDADSQQVRDRELALLDPAVRADAELVRSYLHEDFVEYGASGRVWDRGSITSATSSSAEPITATDLRFRRLGPDAILLTYRSEVAGRRALRSSTWVREPSAGWLLLFHQGTLFREGSLFDQGTLFDQSTLFHEEGDRSS